jgi:putative PIN family toxin of toxin-antitoxin system
MTRIVLDANVLAPGFTSRAGASARLLDLWRTGLCELVVSDHLLAELERAFTDPYYARRLTSEQAKQILSLLRTDALITPITTEVKGIATQPKDDLVLATGQSAQASYLGTRDRQLLKLGSYRGLQILHPADLLEVLLRDLPSQSERSTDDA